MKTYKCKNVTSLTYGHKKCKEKKYISLFHTSLCLKSLLQIQRKTRMPGTNKVDT